MTSVQVGKLSAIEALLNHGVTVHAGVLVRAVRNARTLQFLLDHDIDLDTEDLIMVPLRSRDFYPILTTYLEEGRPLTGPIEPLDLFFAQVVRDRENHLANLLLKYGATYSHVTAKRDIEWAEKYLTLPRTVSGYDTAFG